MSKLPPHPSADVLAPIDDNQAVAWIDTRDIPEGMSNAYRGNNVRRENGKRIVKPSLAELPTWANDGKRGYHPHALRAYAPLLMHDGSIVTIMLGCGRADIPPTDNLLLMPVGSIYRRNVDKQRAYGGIFPSIGCPVYQFQEGILNAQMHLVDKTLLDEQPCPKGTDIEHDCPHFARERDARQARQRVKMEEIESTYGARSKSSVDRLAELQAELIQMMADIAKPKGKSK